VCRTCFNFTDGFGRCYACAHVEGWLDHVAPISYSVAGEPLHRALYGYKRLGGETARHYQLELTIILWRYLAHHERCLAAAVGRESFDLVTTVPSSDRVRDEDHPLRRIVGQLIPLTRRRHHRALQRSEIDVPARSFDVSKYRALTLLNGEAVLLIDDTWTTGASAQSAGAALKLAGAGRVACLVIGRHLNREWHENDEQLRALVPPFEWSRCSLCA